MTEAMKGVLAMLFTGLIWGLSPLFYILLAHVPPPEVLAHRTLWSAVVFGLLLAFQGRLPELRGAITGRRQIGLIAAASVLISINWFLFITAVQINRTTEASLGYYMFPLVVVVIGRFAFGERLARAQWLAVGLAAVAVLVLTLGLGVAPWISLVLAVTFGLYGAIKKLLPVGPVVSVTCEVLLFLPIGFTILAVQHGIGQGAFGGSLGDSVLLILSGPMTAVPLILFSYAARRVALATLGLMQYITPTLQFLCAVLVFGEPFTLWHKIAFALIWAALTIFSLSALRQDKAARRASMASKGVSTQVSIRSGDGSAKP